MSIRFGSVAPRINMPVSPHHASLPTNQNLSKDQERFLVLIKPNAIEKGQAGKMITQLENMYLKIIQMKILQFDMPLLKEHYAEHVEKKFFSKLAEFMQRTPVIAMVMEGNKGALERLRAVLGNNNIPGSIRGRFAKDSTENGLHVSGNLKEATEEVARIFPGLENTKQSQKESKL